VVVLEFLPEGIKLYKTQYEWKKYLASISQTGGWAGIRYDGVPHGYLVVSLDQVNQYTCSKCYHMQPVVKHYVQTVDSPEGDSWLTEYFVLCLECNLITEIEHFVSSGRF